VSDNEERWRNYALSGVWATDSELGVIYMIIFALVIVGAIIYGIYRAYLWFTTGSPPLPAEKPALLHIEACRSCLMCLGNLQVECCERIRQAFL
jgi:hypothetical protein